MRHRNILNYQKIPRCYIHKYHLTFGHVSCDVDRYPKLQSSTMVYYVLSTDIYGYHNSNGTYIMLYSEISIVTTLYWDMNHVILIHIILVNN